MRLPSADANPVPSRAALRGLNVTWLGHSTFLMTSPKGVRLLFDPFLTNNPSCPPAAKRVGNVDLIMITHGHSDHCEDAASVARETGAPSSPRRSWLDGASARRQHLRPMNIGGRQMLSASTSRWCRRYSNSAPTQLSPDLPLVCRAHGWARRCFAGDTLLACLIRDRHAPVLVTIGDQAAMGPERWQSPLLAGCERSPMHYGTAELTGTVEEVAHARGAKGLVIELRAGAWFVRPKYRLWALGRVALLVRAQRPLAHKPSSQSDTGQFSRSAHPLRDVEASWPTEGVVHRLMMAVWTPGSSNPRVGATSKR